MYNVPLIFIVGDYDYYQKICRKVGLEKLEQCNYGGESLMIQRDDDFLSIVWIPRLTFTTVNYGVIVHELLHVSFRVMEKVGFKLDYNNHEPINYYLEYLLVKSLEKLKRYYK